MKKKTKSKTIIVRVLPEQYALVEDYAKMVGVKVSVLLRMLIDNLILKGGANGNK